MEKEFGVGELNKCFKFVSFIFKKIEDRYILYENFQKNKNCEALLKLLISWNKGLGIINKIPEQEFCSFIENFLNKKSCIETLLKNNENFDQFLFKYIDEEFHKITQKEINKQLRIPTIKLLHFLFPDFYPIFDNPIMKSFNIGISDSNYYSMVFKYKKCFQKTFNDNISFKEFDEYLYLTKTKEISFENIFNEDEEMILELLDFEEEIFYKIKNKLLKLKIDCMCLFDCYESRFVKCLNESNKDNSFEISTEQNEIYKKYLEKCFQK